MQGRSRHGRLHWPCASWHRKGAARSTPTRYARPCLQAHAARPRRGREPSSRPCSTPSVSRAPSLPRRWGTAPPISPACVPRPAMSRTSTSLPRQRAHSLPRRLWAQTRRTPCLPYAKRQPGLTGASCPRWTCKAKAPWEHSPRSLRLGCRPSRTRNPNRASSRSCASSTRSTSTRTWRRCRRHAH